jgi:sugar phosphate isomerase/epimerase
MKLGTFTVVLGNMPLDKACGFLAEKGVQMVEIGCGGYPGKAHCNPDVLLNDEKELQKFQDTIKKHGLEISALSCHGNMVHPDPKTAKMYEEDFTKAILIAEKLGIHIVNTFSGCPGGGPEETVPNWVTCSWPEDYARILEYQWNEVLIPYWKKKVAFAREHGVDKIALELHPGFCVYNTSTLLSFVQRGSRNWCELRSQPFDWQGWILALCIRELVRRMQFSTSMRRIPRLINIILHTMAFLIQATMVMSLPDPDLRSVVTVILQITGSYCIRVTYGRYDYVLSIEHEDSLMSGREGLTKAIDFLKDVLIFEEKGVMFWA